MTTDAPTKRRWKMPMSGNIATPTVKVVIRQTGNIASVARPDHGDSSVINEVSHDR